MDYIITAIVCFFFSLCAPTNMWRTGIGKFALSVMRLCFMIYSVVILIFFPFI